ncbi:unnamed protein product [Linum trigynum]|uniref:Uncharacterized protein n=1 Tax=Linum trigynum TaxID=586398 RepID=A0AAV2DAE7_9ROSI
MSGEGEFVEGRQTKRRELGEDRNSCDGVPVDEGSPLPSFSSRLPTCIDAAGGRRGLTAKLHKCYMVSLQMTKQAPIQQQQASKPPAATYASTRVKTEELEQAQETESNWMGLNM